MGVRKPWEVGNWELQVVCCDLHFETRTIAGLLIRSYSGQLIPNS